MQTVLQTTMEPLGQWLGVVLFTNNNTELTVLKMNRETNCHSSIQKQPIHSLVASNKNAETRSYYFVSDISEGFTIS